VIASGEEGEQAERRHEMDWQEAKEATLHQWRDLRSSVGRLDEVDLLTKINEVNELCEKAKQQAEGEMNRCDYCIAFHQFGGCMGVSLQMSECAVDGDKERLKELMDQFIVLLGRLET
jgi:hypothetical protein